MRSGSILSVPLASFILLCFFLPWVSVSCAGEDIMALSGVDLAAGKEINLGFGTERTEGDSLLFAIPAAAALSLILALSTLSKENSNGSAALQLLVALAAIGILGYRGWEMYDAALETRGSMIDINIKAGLWGTAGGLIGLIIGAMMTLSEKRQTADEEVLVAHSSGLLTQPALACFNCSELFPRQVKFCPKCGAKQPVEGV